MASLLGVLMITGGIFTGLSSMEEGRHFHNTQRKARESFVSVTIVLVAIGVTLVFAGMISI